MKKLRNGDITGSPEDPSNIIVDSNVTDSHLAARQSGSYWLPSLAPSGKVRLPLFFHHRHVVPEKALFRDKC
jgi:hypothetical protein